MRIALLLVVLALAGCGKKKSAQSPASAPAERAMDENKEEKDNAAPTEADDPAPRSSDPQEGGE